nr:oligosaccharide flippase family protein [Bacilli bacterium]
MRTKKVFLNLLSEVLPQLIIAVISFVRVKIFLTYIGDEILGVYQLFGQVLAYLSLAELGLTDAAMYFLYKPLYEKKNKDISALISGVKKSFNYVMMAMLVIGCALSFLVPHLIAENTLPNPFIITCFILTLLVNVLGYFSTTYTVLFNADQNKYKYSFYTQGLLILRNIADIVVIIFLKNLYAVLVVEILFTLLQNLVMKVLYKKNYPNISVKEKPNYVFWSKTKSLIPHKIGGLIAYNIDVILVSKILGLGHVVIYNAYYAITSVISNIIGKFSSSTLASVGNLLVAEPKKAYNVFLEYNDMLFFIANIICVPLAVFLTPFISLWYGANYTVGNITMYLFIFNLLYGIIRIILNVYSGAAALYKETLICTYLEALINLVVSLVLILNGFGIAGLLAGTASSMLISEFMIKPSILNKHIFKSSISKYYLDSLILFILIIVNIVIFKFIMNYFTISNLLIWFIYGIVIFILNFGLTFVWFKLLGKDEFFKRITVVFKRS